MHLCISSSTFEVKTLLSSPVIMFVSIWKHTKYNVDGSWYAGENK
jgi:hypothetical protein